MLECVLLSKVLWNIHTKKDSLWYRWIDHVDMKNSTILRPKHKEGFPLFYQKVIEYQDNLITMEGLATGTASRLDVWHMRSSFVQLLTMATLAPSVTGNYGPRLLGILSVLLNLVSLFGKLF